MTRQATDQLYIDLDYFTPEEYYVYTAEAAVAVSSAASVACDATVIAGGIIEEASGNLELVSTVSATVGVIKSSEVTLTVTSTTSAMISHIEGADLFAFAEAQLSAEVSVIRSYNIAASSQFNTAIDAVRGIYVSAQADAVSSIDISGLRTRAVEAAAYAAFSLAADSNITKSTLVDISSETTVSADVSRFRLVEAAANLSSQFTTIALGLMPSRVVDLITYSGGSYSNVSIDTTEQKWGAGSLLFTASAETRIEPTLFSTDGSGNWIGITNGYTWTSTDNGDTWSRATNNLADLTLVNLRYLNGQYVLTNFSSSVFRTSSDGITWTTRTPTFTAYTFSILDVAYANGVWLVLGSNGDVIYAFRSSNLSTWSNTSSSQLFNSAGGVASYSIRDFAVSGSSIALICEFSDSNGSSYSRLFTSTDSITWTSRVAFTISNTPFSRLTNVATNGSGTWVATGNSTTEKLVYRSTNFTTWTKITQSDEAIRIDSNLEFVNGNFIAVSTTDDFYKSTDNGTNWSILEAPTYSDVIAEAMSNTTVLFYASNRNRITKTTNNFNSYSYNTLGNVSGLLGYLEYSNRNIPNKFRSWKTIEFWIRPIASSGSSVVNIVKNRAFSINLQYANGSSNIRNETVSSFTTFSISNNEWTHIRAVNDGANFAFYKNGVKQGTTNSWTADVNDDAPLIIGAGIRSLVSDYRIDELLITDQQLNLVSDTTFTVPTGPYSNTADTSLLLHFDTNFEDDASQFPQTKEAAAALSGIFDDSILTVFAANASATLTSTVAVTASVEVTRSYTADIASESTVSSTVERLRDGQSAIDSASTVAVDVNVLAGAIVAVSSAFAQTANNTRTRDVAIATDAIATQLSAVAKTGAGLVTMEVVAVQTSTVVKTTDVSSAVESTTTLTAEPIKAVDGAASLSATASLTAAGNRLRSSSVDQASEFNQTASLNIIHGANAAVLSQFAVEAQATGEIRASAALSVNASLTVDVDRFRTASSDFTSTFNSSAEVIKTVGYASSIESTAVLAATANRIQTAVIATDSVASQLTAVAKTGQGLVTCEVSASLVAGASIIAENEITAILLTQLAADAVKTVEVNADLTTISNSSIEGTTNITAEADLTTQFAMSAAVNSQSSGIVLTASAGSMSATVGVIKPLASAMTALAFEVTLGQRSRDVGANLTAISTVTAVIGGVFNNQANLQGFAAALVVGNIIHITPTLTYTVPAENTVYSIQDENRLRDVVNENRNYLIRG